MDKAPWVPDSGSQKGVWYCTQAVVGTVVLLVLEAAAFLAIIMMMVFGWMVFVRVVDWLIEALG